MPAGNTNILKEFVPELTKIDEGYVLCKKILEGYINNSDGIYSVEIDRDALVDLESQCNHFIEKWEIVIRTNQLKNSIKYQEGVLTVKEKLADIKDAINILNSLISQN